MTEERNMRREKKVARMRRYLIEATEDLIHDEGFGSVTLRKIGDETGYNTATIYNYFKDLNELLLYSSVKFLKSYNRELSMRLDDSMNSIERYICVFRVFCKHTFAHPDVYFNMFYGKHGKNLGDILQDYYTLFPDEMGKYDEVVSNMLNCGDIFEREHLITAPIAREGFASEADARYLSHVSIFTHEYLLRELCEQKQDVTAEVQAIRYEDTMMFLLRKIKTLESPAIKILQQ